MTKNTGQELIAGLAWGGSAIVVAFAATFARKLGYIDQDTVIRLVIGLNGIWIAWYGNRMPKTFVPSACARQARRVAGWSMALSGLVYVGLFAFAPIRVAALGGAGAVLAGIAVTLVYCLSLRDKAKAA
ncbi:MAG TPA: ammonium transporter [Sphingomonas sp.]|nr:ammonium transporter [Sphingomonas sp.]